MDQVNTFRQMQEEAFRIQKDMFIRIKDLKLLDVSEDDIYDILKKAVSVENLRSNLLDGNLHQ